MQKLPIEAEALYQPDFLSFNQSTALYEELMAVFSVQDKYVSMADGSSYEATLATYLFTDLELCSYDKMHQLWGRRSLWTHSLETVRDRIHDLTGTRFQVARCLYYRDGQDEIAFHQDLPAYGSTKLIASLSLGAPRTFVFRKIDDPLETYSLVLESGSLLIMGEGCQEQYEHSLPCDDQCTQGRLNLTFRQYD